MELKDLKPFHKNKKGKRVGRGGKKGTYCGRGVKGQKARSGRKMKPVIRDLFKRYPKLRGYRFKSKKIKPQIVNLGALEKNFNKNDKITPEILFAKGLIRKVNGRLPKVKILCTGVLTKALTIENCFISKSAENKIVKAGGKILLNKK